MDKCEGDDEAHKFLTAFIQDTVIINISADIPQYFCGDDDEDGI